MSHKKKELKREYRLNPKPMGVFQIRNLVNEKVFLGTSLNLPAILNRHQFQLQIGNHPNKVLQAEWNQYGSGNFVFEILDELTPREDPAYDYKPDLAFLEDWWLEKLEPYGENGYNEKKKSQEEKLRIIMKSTQKE